MLASSDGIFLTITEQTASHRKQFFSVKYLNRMIPIDKIAAGDRNTQFFITIFRNKHKISYSPKTVRVAREKFSGTTRWWRIWTWKIDWNKIFDFFSPNSSNFSFYQ